MPQFVAITSGGTLVLALAEPPAAPTFFTAISASATEIDLTWVNNAEDADAVRVYRSTDGGETWGLVATLAADAASYADTGLAPGTAYTYEVRAVNTSGESASGAITVSTQSPSVPAAPSGLAATAAGESQVNLTWADNASDETGFVLERSPDGSTDWAQVATPSADATSASDAGLSPSTTYYYRLKAVNAAGPSAYSNVASATTAAPGAATLLSDVVLTNSTASPTDARTLLRLGHPFKQGDVPAGSRLKATWTPSGGTESGALAIQQDFSVSHPDGSLRFCGLCVELPQVAASGAGTLLLYSESGAPATTLPGGRTVAQVVADLASGTFPGSDGGCFSVSASKLTKGREKFTLTAQGSGYPAFLNPNGTLTASRADGTLVWSGGTGGTPADGREAAILTRNSSTGAITAIVAQAPQPRFDPTTPAPTLAISSASGSGATATFDHPALDGSGEWSWSAATQLALFGSTDARGRTRCEAIASGPLCVSVWCWGPLTSAGADHPHLHVRAYYHCWLASDGSIDRVEYLHTIGQGWIEDLNGGAVKADLQVGDVSVSCGGVALDGQSWPSLRMPAFAEASLATVGPTDYHAGGSRWTSGYPALHATFDTRYWASTGVVPPFDLDYHLTKPVVQAGLETTVTAYAPGFQPVDSAGAKFFGQCPAAINGVGGEPHIGVLARWSAKAFLTQSPDFVQTDTAMAHVGQLMPDRWRNPATGRIAHCSAGYDGGTNAQMGAARSASQFVAPARGSGTSDFKIADYDKGFGNGDPTNSFGGWILDTGYGPDHFPTFAYHAYLRTAQPWFLETIKLHGTNPVIGWTPPGFAQGQTAQNQVGNSRDFVLPDGTTLHGRFTSPRGGSNIRAEAWSWKLLYQCLAALPDAAIERPYYESIYADNARAATVIVQYGTPNFRDQGAWMWPQPLWTKDAAHPGYNDSPWMQHYLFFARACEYLALGRPADTLAFLRHHVRQLAGRNGAFAGNPCGYGGCAYRTWVGNGADWYSWDEIPHASWADLGASIDGATGRVLGVSGHNIVTDPFAQTSLQVGDLLRFGPLLDNANISDLPPVSGTSGGASVPITQDRWYYIASVDPSGVGALTISPNADLSDPFTAFASSPTKCALAFRKEASCPTPSATPGSVFTRKTAEAGAGADAGVLGGCVRLAVGCGVVATTDPLYQNTVGPSGRVKYLEDNRWTSPGSNYQSDPTWHMAEAT